MIIPIKDKFRNSWRNTVFLAKFSAFFLMEFSRHGVDSFGPESTYLLCVK